MQEERRFEGRVQTATGELLRLSQFIRKRAADKKKSSLRLDSDGQRVRKIVNESKQKYENSPEAKKREEEALQILRRGALTVPDGAHVLQVRNPGLKGALKENISIFEKNPSEGKSKETRCKKGDKVIVHSSSDPDFCIVEIYEFGKKMVNKKEKDDTRKPKILHKGFAPISKIKISQKFVKTDKPLFEKEPCLEDIKQGAIGDCFLLAGLGSMISKDRGVIKRSILDNGDGTITVRLFDKTEEDEKPKFKEKFITFEKSVLKSDDGDYAQDSLWVQMLEKAYAIHGDSKGKSASYMQLNAGGFSQEVFEAFLGRAGVKESISKTPKALIDDVLKEISSAIPFYVITEKDKAQIKSKLKELGVSASAIQTILAEYDGKTFLNSNDDPTENMSKVWPSIEEDKSIKGKLALPELKSVVSFSNHPDSGNLKNFKLLLYDLAEQDGLGLEDVEQLAKTSAFKAFTAEAQQAVRKSIKNNFSGPGEYTVSDEEVWEKLKEGLEKDGCIAVCTKEFVGTKTSKGKSAGEPVSKGLVGNHAFTVTGLHEPKEEDPLFVKGTTSPVKYVRIRNPWGDGSSDLFFGGDEVGRTYKVVTNKETGEFIKLAPSKTHKGEFCLELSDLTRRGNNMYTTPPIISEEKLLTDKITELTAETKDDVEMVDTIARGILYKEGMAAAVEWVEEKVLTDKIHQLTAETDLDPMDLLTTAQGILRDAGMEVAVAWVRDQIAEG